MFVKTFTFLMQFIPSLLINPHMPPTKNNHIHSNATNLILIYEWTVFVKSISFVHNTFNSKSDYKIFVNR